MEIQINSILHTRNGEIIGNGIVYDCDKNNNIYTIKTDLGAISQLPLQLLNNMFTVGEVDNTHPYRYNGKIHTIEAILYDVSKYVGYTVEKITSKTRQGEIISARHLAMYLSYEYVGLSFEKIGFEIGKKDHATARHAYKKFCNERDFKLIAMKNEFILKYNY